MVIFHSYVSLPEGMSCFVSHNHTRIDGSSQRFNAPQLVDGESLRAYAHRQPCHKLPEHALPRNTHVSHDSNIFKSVLPVFWDE